MVSRKGAKSAEKEKNEDFFAYFASWCEEWLFAPDFILNSGS